MKIIQNEIKQIKNEINNNNSYFDIEIENIRRLETVIKNNRSFLIPSSTKILSQKKCENSKTNICKICKYNCHKNCKHSIKRMCSCFDWSFKCKYCPNKCSADAHEITNYEHPNYDYFTVYDIMKKYDNNFDNSIIPNSAILILIKKMEEKRKENQSNLNNKIVNLEKIKYISLMDDINGDLKKHFENNELIYYEIRNIDEKIQNLKKEIKAFPIIDEIDEIKKTKNNIQNIFDEIKKKCKDKEEAFKTIDFIKYINNKDEMNKEINEFNSKMKNIIETGKDKDISYDYLIANYLYLLFEL